MNGFLLINKQVGDSSFDVIRKLRRITGIRKMGHAGTLDPLAQGLMIIAINEATKLLQYILKENKTYETTIEFGKTSETYDMEGPITTVDQKNYTTPLKEEIEKSIKINFLGKITQLPPKYSALKINGKKACDIMRNGGEVELKTRQITIDEFSLQNYIWPNASFKIQCSTGTYIRSLISDLGNKLKCGAYIKTLNRTSIQDQTLDKAITLTKKTTLKDIKNSLISIEEFTKKFPKIEIKENDMFKFMNGMRIKACEQKNYTENQYLTLATHKTKVIGVLNDTNLKNNELKLKKKIHLKSFELITSI